MQISLLPKKLCKRFISQTSSIFFLSLHVFTFLYCVHAIKCILQWLKSKSLGPALMDQLRLRMWPCWWICEAATQGAEAAQSSIHGDLGSKPPTAWQLRHSIAFPPARVCRSRVCQWAFASLILKGTRISIHGNPSNGDKEFQLKFPNVNLRRKAVGWSNQTLRCSADEVK